MFHVLIRGRSAVDVPMIPFGYRYALRVYRCAVVWSLKELPTGIALSYKRVEPVEQRQRLE
jgi:hypothetical protein